MPPIPMPPIPPIPPIPPMPAPCGCLDLGSGLSVIIAAVVSNRLEMEAALIKSADGDHHRVDDARFHEICEFVCQAIVAEISFPFVDFLCDEIALFSAVVGNGCGWSKYSLLDDRGPDSFVAGEFEFL